MCDYEPGDIVVFNKAPLRVCFITSVHGEIVGYIWFNVMTNAMELGGGMTQRALRSIQRELIRA